MAVVLRILKEKGDVKGVAISPFILLKPSADKITVNHERIHLRQQLEMLVLPFYVWYAVEWFIRNVQGQVNTYRRLSHEREAYLNEKDLDYLKKRKPYAWLKYL